MDRAVELRRRRHHLETQLREETTLTAVLLSASSRGTRIELSTTGPGIAGTLAALGEDHLVLESGSHTHVVALAAVTAVLVVSGPPSGAGAGKVRADTTFVEILTDLLATETEVHARWTPDGSCRGRVTSVGPDIVTITRPGSATSLHHVALAHLVSVSFSTGAIAPR